MLIKRADKALASGLNAEAENGYKAAMAECGLLPPEEYHCITDVQWKLGALYARGQDVDKTVAINKQRLDLLVAHQTASARPDLDIGTALFDLQCALSDFKDSTTNFGETEYMEKARRFYEECKAGFPDLRSRCDRRLADVEGIHGSLLTLKMRFDEAAPFLKAVTDRPDSAVRKDIMIAALKAQAKPLMLQGRVAEAQVYLQRAQRLEAVQK